MRAEPQPLFRGRKSVVNDCSKIRILPFPLPHPRAPGVPQNRSPRVLALERPVPHLLGESLPSVPGLLSTISTTTAAERRLGICRAISKEQVMPVTRTHTCCATFRKQSSVAQSDLKTQSVRVGPLRSSAEEPISTGAEACHLSLGRLCLQRLSLQGMFCFFMGPTG